MSNLVETLRDRLRASPLAFGAIGRRGERADFERRVVRRGDDLVIEGYPRSGNTFATMAFRLAQPAPLQIGNHFHAPAQILRARAFGIPALIVLRDPAAAALSLMVYHQGRMSARRALTLYCVFHRPLLTCATAFVVAPFAEVTTDFARSIQRLNNRFGTDFAPYHNTPDADAATRATIENKRQTRLSRRGDATASAARQTTPSAAKEALKDTHRAALTGEVALLARAQDCHARLMNGVGT